MSTDDEDRDLLDGLDLSDGVLTGAAFEVAPAGGTREQILEADRRERARWAELDEFDRRTAEARAQRQELKLREDQLRVADRIRRLRRREERATHEQPAQRQAREVAPSRVRSGRCV